MPAIIRATRRNVLDGLCKRLPVWHNDAEGKGVKMLFSFVNEIKRRRPDWIYQITLGAIGAIALLSVPAARAQSAPQQGEKTEAPPSGNAETGKKIFTKDGCYECHGREGQGAIQERGRASGLRNFPSMHSANMSASRLGRCRPTRARYFQTRILRTFMPTCNRDPRPHPPRTFHF